MISYELAKKLKEAGFPQAMKEGDLLFFNDKIYIHTGGGHLDENNNKEGLYLEAKSACCNTEEYPAVILNIYDKEGVKIPSLLELIEECGDKFLQIMKMPKGEQQGKGWWAYEYPATNNPSGIWGQTPEEAVANLWLKSKDEKNNH